MPLSLWTHKHVLYKRGTKQNFSMAGTVLQ